MRRLLIVTILGVLFLTATGEVSSQPGGGRGGTPQPQPVPGGVQRPSGDSHTPQSPTSREGRQPRATMTIPDRSQLSIPSDIQLPDLTLAAPQDWQDFTMPEDWTQFTLPDDFPSVPDDIAGFLGDYELPYDISLDNLPAESSQEAAAAIVGFASQYLGAPVTPVYAGLLESGQTSSEYQDISASLPEDYQALLESAASISGSGYWALLTDGTAVIYAGDCTGPNCALNMESMQFTITTASLGVYGQFFAGSVSTMEEALQLAIFAYPALTNIPLTPVETDTGYAFAGGGMIAQQVAAYAVGVVSSAGQTVVYTAVGIGEGYAQIVRPG